MNSRSVARSDDLGEQHLDVRLAGGEPAFDLRLEVAVIRLHFGSPPSQNS